MNVGTKSVLFGVHQFVWHPVTVVLAWRKCYGVWPKWRELVAIAVHDLGYWGCPNMDGHEGTQHPIAGSIIAERLAGPDAARLVLFHSGSLCRIMDHAPSKLYLPDKVSVLFEPRWFYLLRGWLSGEIDEYRRVNAPAYFSATGSTAREWFDWYAGRVRAKLAGYRAIMRLVSR